MGPYLSWKESYSVGNEQIDAQHRQILDFINEMYAAIQLDSAQTVVRPLLDRLVDYTVRHFRYEEGLMQAYGYPDLARHAELHDKMRQRTIALRDNANLLTGKDLLNFLREWWSCHIQDEDQRYAPYLITMIER
jgi:hemerythrin-like metal-binding protein